MSFLLGLLFFAQQPEAAAIEAAMQRSVAGWNTGSVGQFLEVYSDGPATSFVAGEGLVRGKPAMKQRYEAKYDFSDAAKRGALTIERLDYRPLGRGYAL